MNTLAPATELDSELAEQARFGELAGTVIHQVSNYLNLVMMQIAILDRVLPEDQRPEIAELRRQGMELAQLVKLLHDTRCTNPAQSPGLDINELAMEAVNSLLASSYLVSLKLGANLPLVRGSRWCIVHLLTFMLNNALRASEGERVTVRTEKSATGVRLSVDDSGPAISEADAGWLFELHAVRPGFNPLELAACKAIAHRMFGNIQAQNRKGGGLSVIVDLPAQ